MSRVALLAVLLAGIPSASAMAQAAAAPQPINLINEKANTNIFAFDFSIPTSPALSLAGLSPDKTPTSTSLKPFVVALPSFLNGNAEGQSIALDFAPAAASVEHWTYDEYMNSGTLERLMVRSRIGAAAYRGVEDPDPKKVKASKLAVGYSVSLLNYSDPFFAKRPGQKQTVWERCVDAAAAAYEFPAAGPDESLALLKSEKAGDIQAIEQEIKVELEKTPGATIASAMASRKAAIEALLGPGSASGDPQTAFDAMVAKQKALDAEAKTLMAKANEGIKAHAIKAGYTKAVDDCGKLANAEARSAMDLDLGAGLIWNGAPENFDRLGKGSGAVWAAYKHPLIIERSKSGDILRDDKGVPVRSWMIGGVARYAWREAVATGDATTPTFLADTWDAWVGLEVIERRGKLAFQYGWFEADARSPALRRFSQSGERWLASGAVQLDREKGIWANFSYGVAEGTTTTRNDKKVLLTITFAPPQATDLFKTR